MANGNGINSVESSWLAHLTDDQIREGIEKDRSRFMQSSQAFPGTDVKGCASVEEALVKADANFEVIKRPIMAVISEDDAVEVPGAFAMLREDTMTPLSKRCVTGTYEIVQTREAFAAADVLISQGDFEPASVLVDGARIRMSGFIGADAVQRLDSDAPDVICHFATFSTAHDGSGGVEASLSSLRLACFNGMTSREMIAGIKVRHTRNAGERIAEAASTIFELREQAKAETATFQKLAEKKMTPKGFEAFANELLDGIKGLLDEESSERKRAKREREINELVDLFSNGQGNSGSSRWDGYNSVTEWLDHKLERGGISDEQRRLKAFTSNDSGYGNKLKARALNLLTR
jgi:phage/plasmid-like protein (TIGR03299 family)